MHNLIRILLLLLSYFIVVIYQYCYPHFIWHKNFNENAENDYLELKKRQNSLIGALISTKPSFYANIEGGRVQKPISQNLSIIEDHSFKTQIFFQKINISYPIIPGEKKC